MIDQTTTLTNHQGTLGPINLGGTTGGTSGATWDSTEKMGYALTGPGALQIPHFTPLPGVSSTQASLTVSFWIKIETAVSTQVSLFKYLITSTPMTQFSLSLNSNGKINVRSGDIDFDTSEALGLGVWRLVTANFLAALQGGRDIAAIYFESSLVGFRAELAVGFGSAIYSSADQIILEGTGTIYNLKIWSPGSRIVAKPNNMGSSCLLHLGYEVEETCLWKLPCSSTSLCKGCSGSSGDLCGSCYLGFEDLFQGCKVCPSGQYFFLADENCQKCPTGCKTCTSEIDCTACEDNYTLESGLCSSPAACSSNPEYYLYTSDNICREKCSYPNIVVPSSPTQKLCSLGIDTGDYEQAQNLADGAQAGGTTSGVAGIIMSLIDSASPSSFTMASLSKMLQFMKFLRVNYPPKLYLMLLLQKTASGGLNFVPEMSDSMKKAIPDKELPMQFEIHKIHSNFLVGFWQPLISMLILLGVIGILYLIEIYAKSYKSVQSVLVKISPHIRWNLFLTVFCSNYCDLAFYTAVSLLSVNLESGYAILGFLICLGFNTIAFFLVVFKIQTLGALRTARKHQSEDDLKKKYEKYKMIFEVFKDQSYLHQSFVIVFSIRAYAYSAVVGYLYNFPVVQAVLLMLLCLAMLLYLLIARPMKILINLIQQIFCELILLLVNLCVLIMSIIDQQDPVDNSKKDGYGAFILLMNIVLSWAMPVFSILKVVLIVKEQIAARKSKPATKVPAPDLQTQGHTTDMATLQTYEAAPPRKLPRIQMPNRPRHRPTIDHEMSSYQISENNETSMAELTRHSPNIRRYY